MPDPISLSAGAKALTKAGTAAELPDDVEQFLERVSGGARREIGAWMGDHFRYRRMKAQLRLLQKANEHLRKNGRTAREIKWSVLFPLLEAASLEEDEDMAQRWADLLATAADPAADDVPASFPEVLRQLSRDDGLLLVHAVELLSAESPSSIRLSPGVDTVTLSTDSPLADMRRFDISLDNLLRVRILADQTESEEVWRRQRRQYAETREVRSESPEPSVFGSVRLTSFGLAFVTACKIFPRCPDDEAGS